MEKINKLYDFVKGPCGIVGVSTKNTLISYSIKKFATSLNSNSFIKYDAYTSVPDNLTIVLSSNDGNEYFTVIALDGNNSWNNFTTTFSEFKTKYGMPLKNFAEIYSMTLYSMGSVLVNNFLIL